MLGALCLAGLGLVVALVAEVSHGPAAARGADSALPVAATVPISTPIADPATSGGAASTSIPGPADRIVEAPCGPTAEVCVQLSTQHAWLVRDGRVVRDGFISSGAGGEEETPTGTFTVQWKDRDHISGESGTPMPYSVFFDDRGHALHQGNLDTQSAGCVRLTRDDAAAFFAALEPGDKLQILA